MNKGITNKRIVIIVLVVFVLAFLIFFAAFRYLLNGFRVSFLCKTDHHALLEACNELSKRVAKGNLKPGEYTVRFDPDPEVSKFPRPILELRPSYVYIDENDSGRVMIEMLGGLGHFGVLAYTEDFKKPYDTYSYGDKELIPRLWYYDDGYRDNPKYHKKIDALIQKGKKAR
ncbi:MAG: hypothetical protein HQ580_08300 [Planctomycetes bacterium]|nr:hypothetical protein [Planctomycetota bacterium]